MIRDKAGLLLTLSLLWTSAFCQTTIKGVVSDSLGKPIPYTQVLLKPETGSSILSFTQSNNKGEYSISIAKHGNVSIEFRAISYQTVIYPLTILESQREQEITLNPTLRDKSVAINEVMVMGERPITIKRDTIIFRASAFTRGDEQVAEDLLKRLPGIEVTEDGGINWQGKEVEKVMIEGDDLFGKGYRIISRNLNAQVIDKVEVYERYSHNPLLKDIEESNKVALNLTMREDVRLTFFGNTTLGYSTNKTHMARGNLMSIGHKQKYYLFGNSNSIGKNPVGDIRHFIKPLNQNEHESIPTENSTPQHVISLSGFHPNLRPHRVRDNNSNMLSLNSILSSTERLTFKVISFGILERDIFLREGFRNYYIDDTSFTNIETHELTKKLRDGLGKLEIIYKPTRSSMLVLKSQVLHSKDDSRSSLSFNNNPTNESLNNIILNTDHQVTYTNRLSNKTAFIITGQYQFDYRPEEFNISTFTFNDLINASSAANGLSQNVNSKMQLGWGQAKLISRFHESYTIDTYFGGLFKSSTLESNLRIIPSEESNIENDNFSNNLSHKITDIYLGGSITRKLGSVAFNLAANGHILYHNTKNIVYSKDQIVPYIEPKAGVQWEVNRMNKFNLLFVYNASQVTLMELTSGYILTGYRTLHKGLGEFYLNRGYTTLFTYSYGRSIDRFFFNTTLLHSKSDKYISSDSHITQNYSLFANIIGKDREVISANNSVDLYISSLRSNIRIKGDYINARYENNINSNLIGVETHNINLGTEIRTSLEGFFNLHLGANWVRAEVRSEYKNSNINNNQFLDLLFKFTESLNAQVNLERYEFGNIQSPNNPWFFIDANATYQHKPNRLSLTLTANNILNNNEFGSYSVSEISESGTLFKIIPRYIMLRVDFRF